jgi:hypothetical protein
VLHELFSDYGPCVVILVDEWVACARQLAGKGDFAHIPPMPATGADVPNDLNARLVVLGVDHPYSKESDSAGELAAKAVLECAARRPAYRGIRCSSRLRTRRACRTSTRRRASTWRWSRSSARRRRST